MTDSRNSPDVSRESHSTARRRLRNGALLVLGALAIAAVVWLSTLGDDAERGGPSGTLPSDAAAVEPSSDGQSGSLGPVPGESGGPPSAPSASIPSRTPPSTETPVEIETRRPVQLDETASFGDGVSASLISIRAVTGSAQGVGEIAGPALELGISITNQTEGPLSLRDVVVNVTYGESESPAAILTGDPAHRPFSGTLARGGSAESVYVFAVPPQERDVVAISVSYAPLSPIVLFRGPAPR